MVLRGVRATLPTSPRLAVEVLPPDLSTRVRTRLEAWCDERVPLSVRNKVVLQFRIRGDAVVLLEMRAHWQVAGA